MNIGLLGDVHSHHAWLRFAIREFHVRSISTVLQVGDLGVSGDHYAAQNWSRSNKYLKDHGMTMYAAPGNHEDYDIIDRLTPMSDGWLPFRSRILLAPRGLRTEFGDRSFVWLGGAGSVDRTKRTRGRTISLQGPKYWWEQEAVTDEDVTATAAGGHADIMVSHDAPTGVPEIDLQLLHTQHMWTADDLAYAHQCRQKFTEAVSGVRPDLLLHGHYHFGVRGVWTHPDGGSETRIVGLSRDGDLREGLGILDTETMQVQHLDVRRGRHAQERGFWS